MKTRNITCSGILVRALEWWHGCELRRVARKIPGAYELVVQGGPFRGLQLASDVDPSKNLPKIIGSYEMELHKVIDKLIKRDFRLFLNVGAAEGYYAVGMAMRMPMCKVIAFEMDEAQAKRCRSTAILNSVERRITVRGKCDSDALAKFDLDDSLIIMDCEGAEIDILQGILLPRLSKTWLLIELHDSFRPGASRILYQRFHHSHEMEFIEAASRNPDSWVAGHNLSMRQKTLAVFENRLGTQEWVIMTPKS